MSGDDPTEDGLRVIGVQTFTADGTFTPVPGTRTVKVYARPADAGPTDYTDPPATGGLVTVVSYG